MIKLIDGYCLVERVVQSSSGLILADTVKSDDMFDIVLRSEHPKLTRGAKLILKNGVRGHTVINESATDERQFFIVACDDIIGWYSE